ncbi:MAG: hypothetical protein FWD98_00905 [Defluviitaleaceae bacterium]|nr:hypothetical protein [Defluviitaleaceae bacterium]
MAKTAAQPSIPNTNIDALDPKAERRRRKEEAKRAKKDSKKGKSKGKIIALILLPLILAAGALAVIVFLNPMNLRDGALAPVLVNVPFVSDFVQPYGMEYYEAEPERTPAELTAEIGALSAEMEVHLDEIARLSELNTIYMSRISELEAQVVTQDVLEANRAAFEAEAATAAPDAFAAWFESFDPERAAEIFSQIVYDDAREQEYRRYIADILAMDEGAVSDVFETMIPVDTQLVVAIMQRLPANFSGEVLSNMEPANAALIIRQMYPGDFFDGTAVEVE